MAEITIEDIRAAAKRIRPIAAVTPVFTSRSFDERTGLECYLKCENLQRGGSFKIRGAANFLAQIPQQDLPRGVVAFSSGNHAQAVAIAAAHAQTSATIVMPDDAPHSKVEATERQGARIIRYNRFTEDREAIGRKVSEETGATLVPPFDHPWIIAGAGTVGLELTEQVQGLDAIVVCLGGGGLLAGTALAAKAANPRLRIFGVEPAAGNDWKLSLERNERVKIDPPQTIADGLRTQQPGAHNFPIIQQHVEDVLLVSDDELRAAAKFILSRLKLLVEPSGAAAAAAVVAGKLPAGVRRIGITLSGGNVDLEQVATW